MGSGVLVVVIVHFFLFTFPTCIYICYINLIHWLNKHSTHAPTALPLKAPPPLTLPLCINHHPKSSFPVHVNAHISHRSATVLYFGNSNFHFLVLLKEKMLSQLDYALPPWMFGWELTKMLTDLLWSFLLFIASSLAMLKRMLCYIHIDPPPQKRSPTQPNLPKNAKSATSAEEREKIKPALFFWLGWGWGLKKLILSFCFTTIICA